MISTGDAFPTQSSQRMRTRRHDPLAQGRVVIDRRRRSGEGTVVALTCLGQPVGGSRRHRRGRIGITISHDGRCFMPYRKQRFPGCPHRRFGFAADPASPAYRRSVAASTQQLSRTPFPDWRERPVSEEVGPLGASETELVGSKRAQKIFMPDTRGSPHARPCRWPAPSQPLQTCHRQP